MRLLALSLPLIAAALLAVTLPGSCALEAQQAAEIIREQSYYVPYEKIGEVFEKEGRGIFLPYDRFLELWARAGGTDPDVDAGPPAAAVIRGGEYVGRVEGDTARLQVRYSVEVLAEGWSSVPLPLRDLAVESVQLSDERVVVDSGPGGYAVYFPEPAFITIYGIDIKGDSIAGKLIFIAKFFSDSLKEPIIPALR